ncbi:MAG: hypothetical protein ACHQO8_03685 [Vicinamibacterales bacterium]
MRRWVATAVFVASLLGAVVVVAQDIDSGAIMRVFLKDGQALPSLGETAQVADRIVFTLVVGDFGSATQYQLVSLPLDLIDLDRTSRYSESVRASRYAAARGEADYAAMTEDVSRALDDLTKTDDPKERLAVAEGARKRLLEWSKSSYGYRAADGQELTNLFDQVIAELRAAAGESRFTVDLSTGPTEPKYEPLMKTPTLRQSIALALSTASVTSDPAGREAILSSALAASAGSTDLDDLREDASRRLAEERAADFAYASLTNDTIARADAAVQQGNVRALMALKQSLPDLDRAMGRRRPAMMEWLAGALDTRLDAARARRLALDHYVMMRSSLVEYERKARPALAALDGLKPIFEAIRDMTGPGFEWLMRADGHLKTLVPLMRDMQVPPEVADVHATLTSAITMAAEACARRKLAVAANDMPLAREASAAAAGALMLAAQGRQELLARLSPPKNK